MRVYFISLFNLLTLQELRLMAGIGIEVGLQELRSKLVTGIGIDVGLGNGIEVGLQELRSKLVTGIETGS